MPDVDDRYSGRDVIIDMGEERIFAQSTTDSVTNEEVDVTDNGSDGNREVLDVAGVRNRDLSLDGVVRDAHSAFLQKFDEAEDLKAELTVTYPLTGLSFSQVYFFQSVEKEAAHDGTIEFSATLISSGPKTVES
jgi:predicted secreted protein